MDRRRFLLAGSTVGASGLAALAQLSCAPLWPRKALLADNSPLPDMTRYVDMVDHAMARISFWDVASDFTSLRRSPDPERASKLARRATRGLYMTAMFSDLPLQGQLHPDMQDRMLRTLPEIDCTATEITDYLASFSPRQRTRLQSTLRAPADPGMQFLSAFDRHAAENGLGALRRRQTREMGSRLLWRLKNQPASILIDEYVGKVHKLSARSGAEHARARERAAYASEEAFWRWKEHAVESLQSEQMRRGSRLYLPGDPIPPELEPPSAISRSATLMGIGFLLAAAGFAIALAAESIAPAVVGTVGAVVFLIGLISAIVAAI